MQSVDGVEFARNVEEAERILEALRDLVEENNILFASSVRAIGESQALIVRIRSMPLLY